MDGNHHNFSSESVNALYPLIQVSWLMQLQLGSPSPQQ